MSVTRVPVLIWRDHAGLFTGALVEQPEAAAVGTSPREVLSQLKQYLTWLQRNQPWMLPEGEMEKPALTRVQVEVRPEYVVGRRHPSSPLKLTVPCVHGEMSSALRVCSIPPMGLWFSFHEAAELLELAAHYVRDAVRGASPARVARYLNAAEYTLDELVVTTPRERKPRTERTYEALEGIAEPLGERAVRRQFSRAWERDREVAELIERVKRDRANVLLVGAPGVGKTSVLVSAAREVERQIAGDEERRRFWLTNGSRLIAGTPYLGQWEERLENVIVELQGFHGVLCVENLLELVRLGGHDAADSVGAFVAPYMSHRELQVIAEATPEELDACRRLLPGLVDAFQVMHVKPFDATGATRVLDRIAQAGARDLRVETGNDLVHGVYRLFRRFRPYDAFPGKAAGFLTELIQRAAATETALDTSTATARFVEQTGLPQHLVRDDVPLGESEVLAYLSSRVIGQHAACRTAAGVVTTFKAGLNDPARPVGVLLFSGPTGVGKTELARALADYLFGHGQSGDRLVRLDMSEYAGYGASERLVSDARGDAAEFVKRVRAQPFCVVLLDEIEKASPDVFDMLLGVFDEGRLTDRFGRVTTFQSSVIVMTSNLGAGRNGGMGFGAQPGADYDAEVMRFFRPEFYNRLDGVVAFEPLSEEIIHRIAARELGELAKREGLARSGITLAWDDSVVALVAQAGFDRRYGARPLQRAIEERVVTPIARHLAANPDLRDITLHLHVDDAGKIAF
ncbi:MAG: AAA family ATPase [Planctomycetes bacterium]|nr:AAA family ATPase [Planctomycetota bacterium]